MGRKEKSKGRYCMDQEGAGSREWVRRDGFQQKTHMLDPYYAHLGSAHLLVLLGDKAAIKVAYVLKCP